MKCGAPPGIRLAYSLRVETVLLRGPDPCGILKRFEVRARISGTKSFTHTALIIPPIGGLTPFDAYLRRQLNKAGIAVMSMHGFTDAWDTSIDLDLHERGLKRGLTAALWMMEWARRHRRAKTFGVIGTSIGTFYAMMAAAASQDIRSLTLIAGGIPLHKIVAHTKHPILANLKRRRRKKFNIKSLREYEESIRRTITYDPADVLKPARQRKDLVVIATKDTMVPTRYQYRLADHLNTAEILKVNGGHLQTIVKAETLLASRIVENANIR